VPRLQPRNTLLRRLLPPGILAGGRTLQCVAFHGWSLGTRIDSLISDRVKDNPRQRDAEILVAGF